jgi:hypothetical protein
MIFGDGGLKGYVSVVDSKDGVLIESIKEQILVKLNTFCSLELVCGKLLKL